VSIGDYLETKILDAVFRNVSLAVAANYVKLHIGDPGEAGTSNASASTTRKVASWAAASGGTIATNTTLTWSGADLVAVETLTYVSVWDASTAGNHLWNGVLDVPYNVANGDTFILSSGTVICTLD
jgi:hypothetical protein